ncbi:MAG: 50S ribosomal protein L33 [Candidatus Kerfeldbacteria bacterium RIFOXYA2_FULL_38_24]|nr:MAG: 50S ribosomal protein L33 [Candidatus Kerfeldbacteria bacterium RIFOXYA2_FULL_38_24]
MSQDHLIKMDCEDCGNRRFSHKNKRLKIRLTLKRFCKACHHHTTHKETK